MSGGRAFEGAIRLLHLLLHQQGFPWFTAPTKRFDDLVRRTFGQPDPRPASMRITTV